MFYKRLSAIIVYEKRKGEREQFERFTLWNKLQAFNLRTAESDKNPAIQEVPVSCSHSLSHPLGHSLLKALLLYKQICWQSLNVTLPSWKMRESHTHTKRKIPSDFQSSENSNSLLALFHDYKSLIIYESWKQMWFIRVSHRQKINP